ncbi:MAG: cell division protein ZapE, partial [Gammaproteobacteria bacterium]|nr:cell division protein ZapE [Gammaproteobacteria bacterium]
MDHAATATTPLARYHEDLSREDFSPDAAQENAVNHLQKLYDDLLQKQNKKSLWTLIKERISGLPETKTPVRGIYMWGGVGR